MDKKVKIMIIALVCILLIGITGFTYYEKDLSQKEATKISEEKKTELSQEGDNDDEIRPELVINLSEVSAGNTSNENINQDTLNEEEVSACCINVTVNMFDENGNKKNRTQFEEELNGYYENGKINLQDLEYYLFTYDNSAETAE